MLQRLVDAAAVEAEGGPVNFSLFLQLLDADAYADVKSIRGAMDRQRAHSICAAPRKSSLISVFRTLSISRSMPSSTFIAA